MTLTATDSLLIVLVAMPGTLLLDLAGPLDVFTTAHALRQSSAAAPQPGYEVVVAAPGQARQVRSNLGIEITCPVSVTDIQRPIDTLLLVGFSPTEAAEVHAAFYAWLREAAPRVRRISSVCVGAFALARSGLLDGKKGHDPLGVLRPAASHFPRAAGHAQSLLHPGREDVRTYALVGSKAGMRGVCRSWRRYGVHCCWWA